MVTVHPQLAGLAVAGLLALSAGGGSPRAAAAATAAIPGGPDASSPSSASAATLTAQADSLAGDARFDAAIPLYRRVLEREEARLGPDHPDLAAPLQSLASCAYGLHDLEGAERWQARAVAVLQRASPPRPAALAEALTALGLVHYGRQHPHEAATLWSRALPLLLAADPPDHRAIVWLQSDLAEMKRVLGQSAPAESLQVAAIERAREHLPADGFLATLLNNLGALYWDEGRLDEAERVYLEALRVSEADPRAQPARLATAQLNLGVLYRDQARLSEADERMERALELARQSIGPDDARRVIFLLESGRLRADQNRWPEAVALWNEGVNVLSRLATPQELYRALLLQQLGRGYARSGERAASDGAFGEARTLLEQTLGPDHPDVGALLATWAEVVQESLVDDPRRVRRLAEEAARLLQASPIAPEARAQANALAARAAWESGDRDQARAAMERALELAERLRSQRGGGDLTRARFLERFVDHSAELVDWLVHEDQLAAAFDRAERMRARVLRDQLLAGGADLRAGVAPTELARLDSLELEARARLRRAQQQWQRQKTDLPRGDVVALQALAGLQAELAQAQLDVDRVDEERKLHSPAWSRALNVAPQPLDPARVCDALLREEEALLLYQIGPRASFLFLLPADGQLGCFRLEVGEQEAAALGIARGPLTETALAGALQGDDAHPQPLTLAGAMLPTRGVGRMTDAPAAADTRPAVLHESTTLSLPMRMAALRSVLVPDAAWEQIAVCAQVVVVPDAALHLLPFEALVVRPPSPGRPTAWWLDDGPAIRYASSVATAIEVERRAQADGSGAPEPAAGAAARVVSLSDPAFAPWQQLAGATPPPLPGTGRESEAIARAFAGTDLCQLRGGEATESRLIQAAPGARIVHLATHGFVDEDADRPAAALLLAPSGPADDGQLRLEEIYSLPLRCQLAVLSACDTRAGQRVRGEGVFALARAFQSAGALRTVASLWAVADESTALLVERFFASIAAAERAGARVDYSLALRDAKRWLRTDPRYAHPIFWAPLVFSGAR